METTLKSGGATRAGTAGGSHDGTAANDSLTVGLLLLTVVTGLIDAVSFLGPGRVFTANMTGNVVFLGFAVAGVPGLSIARSLTSLVAFLVGAAVGGRVAVVMARGTRRRWLLAGAVTETALLFAAALASVGYDINRMPQSYGLYSIIVLTALAMGLRNATVRKLAVPDMTTTVLTQTLTGLAADSSLAGGSNPRVGRRVASVIAIFAGAALGTLLLRFGLALPLLVSGFCVLATTVVYTLLPASARATGVDK